MGSGGEYCGDYNSIIVDGRVLLKHSEFIQLFFVGRSIQILGAPPPPSSLFAVVGGRGAGEDLSADGWMIEGIG